MCRNIIVINLYRPPFGNIANAISNLDETLKNYVDSYNKLDVLLVGDFNVNILEDSLGKLLLLDLCYEHNFISNIDTPTRLTATTATCLDIIISSVNHSHLSGTVG